MTAKKLPWLPIAVMTGFAALAAVLVCRRTLVDSTLADIVIGLACGGLLIVLDIIWRKWRRRG